MLHILNNLLTPKMATNVVRKCSIHRHTLVLRATKNIISVEINYYSIPNPILPPFHDLIFNPKSTEIVSLHTNTK